MRNNRLNFYIISEQYIKYISRFDTHIAYNKGCQRPYIGIVLIINTMLYFAPMFSPKPQHVKYKQNLTFFKMYGNKEKTDYLGLIRFADMIPVPESEVFMVDTSNRNQQYNMLLNKQYGYINQVNNRKIIREKAKAIHDIVVSDKNNKTTTFYKKLCCDFKILEQKSKEYNK